MRVYPLVRSHSVVLVGMASTSGERNAIASLSTEDAIGSIFSSNNFDFISVDSSLLSAPPRRTTSEITLPPRARQHHPQKFRENPLMVETQYCHPSIHDSSMSAMDPTTFHSTSRANNKERPLPKNFTPSARTVVLGRPEDGFHFGNLQLRLLAAQALPKYIGSKIRREKTEILNQILKTTKLACPVGAFVRKNIADNTYVEVSDYTAREKIGYVLRDLAHDRYRSTRQSKRLPEGRRKERTIE